MGDKLHTTVALKRPDASHSWGICYAILPGGPEVLKVMEESPAFGRIKSGQVIKSVNGQAVIGLTRDEVTELLNIDDEDVIIDIVEPASVDASRYQFGREYGRGSVEPGRCVRRRSDLPGLSIRKISSVEMPTNQPDVRPEFERIYRERKQSRDMTLTTLENVRLQRCASVDRTLYFTPPMPTPNGLNHSSRPPNANAASNTSSSGCPPKPPSIALRPKPDKSTLMDEKQVEQQSDPVVSNLRYMGVHVPSRSFRALATLVGMDPDGADHMQTAPPSANDQQIGKPCRTVIDVRAKAEVMRRSSLSNSSPSFNQNEANGLNQPPQDNSLASP